MLGSPAVNDKFFYKKFYVAGVVLIFYGRVKQVRGCTTDYFVYWAALRDYIHITVHFYFSLPFSLFFSLSSSVYIQYIPVIINP